MQHIVARGAKVIKALSPKEEPSLFDGFEVARSMFLKMGENDNYVVVLESDGKLREFVERDPTQVWGGEYHLDGSTLVLVIRPQEGVVVEQRLSGESKGAFGCYLALDNAGNKCRMHRLRVVLGSLHL